MTLIEFFKEKPGYLKKSAELIKKRLDDKYSLDEINLTKGYINRLRRSRDKPKPKTNTFQEAGMYVSIGCVHVPFHNKQLMSAFMEFLQEYSADIKGLIIAGDFLDMNALSNYDRGMVPIPGMTLGHEYREGSKILDRFNELLPNVDKAFIYGNHCHRFLKYTKDVNNHKLGSALLSPEEGLRLKDRGYIIKTDWVNDFITLGKHLDIYHGEFYNIHPAKKALDTYKSSALFYHSHRISSYVESNMAAFNGGCMLDITAPVFNYASKAQKRTWTNGFNVVMIDEDGMFNVQQIIWYNNKFYYGNKQYGADSSI